MAFLSSESLKNILPPIIVPYDEDRIKHSAYELSLGNETYITDKKKKEVHNNDDPQVAIEPGQFALLITEEKIKIPLENIAFISIKAGKKFKGLVNVSGFHVDPGFSGKLKFTVYNAGGQRINLTVGEPLFLIWFAKLDRKTMDKYDGRHNGQDGITSEDVMNIQGDLASPQILKERIDNLEVKYETKFKTAFNTTLTILGGIFILIFGFVMNKCSTGYDDKQIIEKITPSKESVTVQDSIKTENIDTLGN